MTDSDGAATPYRVCFVCTGNICRSPIAEAVFRSHVERAGLGDRVVGDSAGTGGWYAGEPPEPDALDVLATHGVDGSWLRARQFDVAELATLDLVVALDSGHYAILTSHAGRHAGKVRRLREFDPEAESLDVPDPYRGPRAGFEHVYLLVEAAMPGLLGHIEAELRHRTG